MAQSKRIIVDVESDLYVDFDEFDGKTPDQIIETMKDYAIAYPGRDFYFHIHRYGYDGGKDLTLRERRLENDKEFNDRIKAEKKAKEEKVQKKADKEAKELAEFIRLKKKFEKM